MISVRDVCKRYGRIAALQSLSFSVDRGELVGFVGPNGAGKTTALRVLTGYVRPDSGTVEIAGLSVNENRAKACARLGYMPEGAPMHDEMRVEEYLQYRAALKGLDAARRRERVVAAVRDLALDDVQRKMISRLSRGFRQRVALADALLADPDILILDEPMTGLDPLQRKSFRKLLAELSRGRALLLSTHVLAEVEPIAHRFLLIARGALVADGDADQLRREARVAQGAPLEDAFAALVEAAEEM